MSGFRCYPKRVLWSVCGCVGFLLLFVSKALIYPSSQEECRQIYQLQSGPASGLLRRNLHVDHYDLRRVGLSRWGHKGGLSLDMVSEHNETKHSWGWPETYVILKSCQAMDWYSAGALANVSVIITFIDRENISTLLHTVHSVMQRTPKELLKEIILIADNTQSDDLGEILDIYIGTVFEKVRLYRSQHVLGLIQARLQGIRMAEGDVVVCMDSHVEVQPGWLEPLLYEIQKNPGTLAASGLDWIQKDQDGQWEYRHAGSHWKTYFDWAMVFGFQVMSTDEIKSRKSLTEPIESPVTIGTIFAIKKSWFTQIGEFDSGMKLWGGENLDLPIRTWLCGGRVINVPCSRVAHLEHPHNRDYRNKWQDIINRNYKRFGLVWLEEYIQYLYLYFPELENAKVGNVSDRIAFRSKCPHDFKWYLDHVFPELGLPDKDSFAYGGVQNVGTGLCLDTRYTNSPGIEKCGRPAALSGFYWSKDLQLRFPMHIFNIVSKVGKGKRHFVLGQDEFMSHYKQPGKGSSFIHWKDGPILDPTRQLCLQAKLPSEAVMKKCNISDSNQKWRFKFYNNVYTHMIDGQNEKFDHVRKTIKYWKEEKLKA